MKARSGWLWSGRVWLVFQGFKMDRVLVGHVLVSIRIVRQGRIGLAG